MEFDNSGKLWEFEIYSGNFCISDAIFFMTQSETHNKPTCKFARAATVVPMWTSGNGLLDVGGHNNFRQCKKGTEMTAKLISYIGF